MAGDGSKSSKMSPRVPISVILDLASDRREWRVSGIHSGTQQNPGETFDTPAAPARTPAHYGAPCR